MQEDEDLTYRHTQLAAAREAALADALGDGGSSDSLGDELAVGRCACPFGCPLLVYPGEGPKCDFCWSINDGRNCACQQDVAQPTDAPLMDQENVPPPAGSPNQSPPSSPPPPPPPDDEEDEEAEPDQYWFVLYPIATDVKPMLICLTDPAHIDREHDSAQHSPALQH